MSVARASAIMISTLVASRILGWLRLSVIGARFGESPELDAFWAALSPPPPGIRTSSRQFLSGATAPLVYNAVIIVCTLFLSPFLGIHAVAIGVVVGALFMWLVQLPELTFRRTRYSPALDLAHPGVRDVLRLAGPRTIALGAVQIVFFVDTALASGMAQGSLTALNYAFQLMLLPLGVFSIAISAAIFPTLSHYASIGQVNRMRDAVQQAIRWILFLTLPTAILMIVLRRPIVNLLFQYGAFGAAAREATQAAFLFYSLGLAGHALIQILARAYYASRDTTTPLALTLISIGLNVVLDLILGPIMGINGLALANSIATLVEAVLLFTLLASRARLR